MASCSCASSSHVVSLSLLWIVCRIRSSHHAFAIVMLIHIHVCDHMRPNTTKTLYDLCVCICGECRM